MRFKSYKQFNENIADFFKSAHAAINPDDLIPLEELVGKPRFPTQEEFEEAVEYLDIDPSCLYYNPKDIIAPIMYWDGPIYEPFHGGLNMEALKMMRVKDRLDYKKKDVKKFLDSKDYDRLFTFMDKKILIPSFIKMYDEIPDKDRYEIFKDLYVRSEYGFQSFPIEIIKDCFSKRSLSPDWKKRIAEFGKAAKLKADGTLTIYRGENVDSAKGDDAFSWTLNKKTAKFFADRFSKGSGRIIEKIIKPEEVIDFLEDRGEAEVILFPKKFGKINESSQDENFTDVLLIRGGRMAVRFVLYPDSVKAIQQHANMGRVEWFTVDKDGNFSTETNATEKWIVEKLGDMFKTVIAQDMGEVAALTKAPIFMKWWKDANHRYRGTMMGKKFGLNEKLETKEEFEEKCTHYVWKDIPRKEKCTGHLVQISDYFGKWKPNPTLKDYQNKILWRDPRSNEYNATVLQFNMSDEDVKKYFRPITSTYLNSKKFGI